jgi:hypothetical protein
MTRTKSIGCSRCGKWGVIVTPSPRTPREIVADLKSKLALHLQKAHGLGSDAAELETTSCLVEAHDDRAA